jgi:hypothetical protein
MNDDIINKTKENLDKLKQILSINELLYSAIDIVGDLTNTKMPEYKNELEKNKCFFIDMFKQGHPNANIWTLIEVRDLLSILKTQLTNITDNTVETKKTELIKEIELIEIAIESYNEIQKLKLNQQIINDLVTASVNVLENANNKIVETSAIPTQKSSLLATTITDSIFNSLSDNTYNKRWEAIKSGVNISSQTMKDIYDKTGKTFKSMFSNPFSSIFSEKNKYLDMLNKTTVDGVCENLNNIVLQIAETVCELLKQQVLNTQSDITAGQTGTALDQTGKTTAQSGTVSMLHSIPCPTPIPSEFQLLGTYDNTDLHYNGKENVFCTNNLIQPTTVEETIPISSPIPSPPTSNITTDNLNALVNIATELLNNVHKQNANMNMLVDTAVNLISNPALIIKS